MIDQKQIEIKCAILRKYLEKTQLMLTVIRAGDFDVFESLVSERDEIIKLDTGDVFSVSPEVIALVTLIEEEQEEIDEAFSRFYDDVKKAYNENRKSIKVTEMSRRVDNMYRGSDASVGNMFDIKK